MTQHHSQLQSNERGDDGERRVASPCDSLVFLARERVQEEISDSRII
jgi:hypothetical protein